MLVKELKEAPKHLVKYCVLHCSNIYINVCYISNNHNFVPEQICENSKEESISHQSTYHFEKTSSQILYLLSMRNNLVTKLNHHLSCQGNVIMMLLIYYVHIQLDRN